MIKEYNQNNIEYKSFNYHIIDNFNPIQDKFMNLYIRYQISHNFKYKIYNYSGDYKFNILEYHIQVNSYLKFNLIHNQPRKSDKYQENHIINNK